MNINYTVNRSRKRRKTISLQISDKSELVIAAPYFTPIGEINRFVQEKQNWIHKAIQKHKEEAIKNKTKEYITGKMFYYLGESFPLETFFEKNERKGLVFWGNRFYLNTADAAAKGMFYFVAWYKKKAKQHLRKRVDFFSHELKLRAKSVKITSAEKRWGSCSAEDKLSFSFRLIMAPPAIIDYVIVHELMHTKEKNHSAAFWKLIEAAMPEYKTHRRWLKDNHHKFIL
ncbi:MAG: SprT family zinc-dependent metalloprotease [Smithella sp.]|jgi:predicted metal-dependent hydrolase